MRYRTQSHTTAPKRLVAPPLVEILMPKPSATEMDLMPQIKRIVRDAIQDGLIKSVSLKEFDHKVKTLKGKDLENYIQKLWDEL